MKQAMGAWGIYKCLHSQLTFSRKKFKSTVSKNVSFKDLKSLNIENGIDIVALLKFVDFKVFSRKCKLLMEPCVRNVWILAC